MLEKAIASLDYWFGVMHVRRENFLAWTLTPNENWPDGHSFGFHFSRDCLSFDTPCRFRPIDGPNSYRLSFPEAIDDPEIHPRVPEAALWKRLNED